MLELVMKCDVCLELLEEYLDGELASVEQEQVAEHLIGCASCSEEFAMLTSEQKIFARYDREFEVPPFLWTRVAAEAIVEKKPRLNWITSIANRYGVLSGGFAMGLAIVLFAAFALAGALFLVLPEENLTTKSNKQTTPKPDEKQQPAAPQSAPKAEQLAASPKRKARVAPKTHSLNVDQSDVLSSDLGGLDIDERDTALHIEQTQNLLRSIKNFPVSDADDEIDVTYDKALSRRLLNENIVLRREAEMRAKFPTKTLLADLEPFLIDIANLPDHARPEEVRVIKERVQKTEIVAALVEYQDRGTNNR
jgi:hypothetical protein